jgi:DNA modification methylase
MKPYWTDGERTIYFGDCREILPELDRVSAIVTDPPYELGFMGKSWDSKGISFQKETWQIIRNVCLSGASLLSFGGTRTFHRIACAIEDAGWEIRDTLMWVYGSGFPKSLDISKAIDKVNSRFYDKNFQTYCNEMRIKKGLSHNKLNELMGTAITGGGFSSSIMGDKKVNELPTLEMYLKLKPILELDNRYDALISKTEAEREVIGRGEAGLGKGRPAHEGGFKPEYDLTTPATPEAQLWEGYGTALKPAYESITLAMNPLNGTFANNALKYGVAGLNIDGCRIPTNGQITNHSRGKESAISKGKYGDSVAQETHQTIGQQIGRFPANFIHDGSQQVMELFPNTKSGAMNSMAQEAQYNTYGKMYARRVVNPASNGSAARFFKECKYSLIDLCLSQSYDTMSICKNIYVATAERLLALIQATIENTARLNVVDLQGEQSDPLVKSAVSHADICEIFTALVLVRIKNLASNQETSQAIRDYTSNFRECSLLLNLVSSAEIQANTDITQITTSLLKSFGYVNPATTNFTPEIRRSEPVRFLYAPKASKAERNKGCEELPLKLHSSMPGRRNPDDMSQSKIDNDVTSRFVTPAQNTHPTVKPLALMEYLVKLVKMPEYNLIIDPFMGSGSTLLACIRLGIPCIGIDNDEKSCEITAKRCSQVMELGL